ncbi:hypothetical protein ABIB82_005754 [Bradyrhizobium sp. i1.8.4]
MEARSSPSPRSCGERVGVRGPLRQAVQIARPVPPHPDRIWRCDPTSPRKRRAVRGKFFGCKRGRGRLASIAFFELWTPIGALSSASAAAVRQKECTSRPSKVVKVRAKTRLRCTEIFPGQPCRKRGEVKGTTSTQRLSIAAIIHALISRPSKNFSVAPCTRAASPLPCAATAMRSQRCDTAMPIAVRVPLGNSIS